MKYCPKCKQNKELDDFNNNKNRLDGKQRICRECTKKEQNNYYLNNKDTHIKKISIYLKSVKNWVIEYKKEHGCTKCGEKRWYVIDFHHLDPKTKLFEIGNGQNYSLGQVKKEIEKCTTLCRNCHAELHHLERQK